VPVHSTIRRPHRPRSRGRNSAFRPANRPHQGRNQTPRKACGCRGRNPDGVDSPSPSPSSTGGPIQRNPDSGSRGICPTDAAIYDRPRNIDGPHCRRIRNSGRSVSAEVGRVAKAVGGKAAAKADATKAGAAQPQALSLSGLCHHGAAKEQSKSQDPPLHREVSKRTGRFENGPHPQGTEFQQKRSFVADGFWVAAREPDLPP